VTDQPGEPIPGERFGAEVTPQVEPVEALQVGFDRLLVLG
jgi:hypothetical protein